MRKFAALSAIILFLALVSLRPIAHADPDPGPSGTVPPPPRITTTAHFTPPPSPTIWVIRKPKYRLYFPLWVR